MRSNFHGYYPPTEDQFEELWRDGLVVLDANVLLDLYRLPSTARDELLNALEIIKARLWIPHQVALEFQRSRLTVIAGERKATESALAATSALVDNIKNKVDSLQIDKRNLGINSQPLIAGLEAANDQLLAAIKATHSAQFDITSTDFVRDRLDALLEHCVGPGPKSQADLDSLVRSGEDRYSESIPPGFADAIKDKNPDEATFIFDQIKYQRKFGDLILWRQLIEHAKSSNIKSVILVTSDLKEDWWWKEFGKTIGPRPELSREIKREGGVDLFWMYSSSRFLEHAKRYLSAPVSTESVAEIEHVALSGLDQSTDRRSYLALSSFSDLEHRARPYLQMNTIETSVERWLNSNGQLAERNRRGFPDFVARDSDGLHGYEVKFLRTFRQMLVSPITVNALLRGYLEVREGRLSRFTLIIAIPPEDFFDIDRSEKSPELHQRLARLLQRYPADSIIVGSVIDDTFEVLAHHGEPSREDDEFAYQHDT